MNTEITIITREMAIELVEIINASSAPEPWYNPNNPDGTAQAEWDAANAAAEHANDELINGDGEFDRAFAILTFPWGKVELFPGAPAWVVPA